jgi:hypothetical protein
MALPLLHACSAIKRLNTIKTCKIAPSQTCSAYSQVPQDMFKEDVIYVLNKTLDFQNYLAACPHG